MGYNQMIFVETNGSDETLVLEFFRKIGVFCGNDVQCPEISTRRTMLKLENADGVYGVMLDSTFNLYHLCRYLYTEDGIKFTFRLSDYRKVHPRNYIFNAEDYGVDYSADLSLFDKYLQLTKKALAD